jgi:hypothetical protein
MDTTCPSGLQVRMREMTVADEELFLDRQLLAEGRIIDELLKSCVIALIDKGPYTWEGEIEWDSVLMADRTFLIIQLRILSFGAHYQFKVKCPNCERFFRHPLKLDTLNTLPVSDAGKQYLRDGKAIEEVLDDGKYPVSVRLLNGDDERILSTLDKQEKQHMLTQQLTRRIVSLGEVTEEEAIFELVQNMPSRISGELWDVTDDLEGGVDTIIPVDCPHSDCEHEQEMILPFDANFFSSRKRFSRSRRRRRGKRTT